MKKIIILMCVLALSVFSATCYAVEDDGEGNILQSKTLTLDGDDTPPPAPKVIVKERVVHQCPTGYSWTPEVRKCLDADGNEFAPVRKQAPKPQMAAPSYGVDERHVFPIAQFRVSVGQCVMSGESITCDLKLINAGNDTRLFVNDATITDNLGMAYKTGQHSHDVSAGEAAIFEFKFNYVNTAATSVQFTGKVIRFGFGTGDTLRFTMPVVK